MLLEIKELSVKVKSSGVKAVNGINLSVDEGEPLLILGQSGSGKTMICRALFGLTNRFNFDVSGQIFFEGKDIMSAEAKKRRKLYGSDIALIPQNPMTSFDPSCKLGNQLAETYRIHNKSSVKAAQNAVFEAMHRAGLEQCKAIWSSYPYMLSGGMLQRAAVAAAIINHPKLIIADEPTTALDAEHRIAVTNLLKGLCGSAAVIMITHDFAVADRFGGYAYIMKNGVFVEQGNIEKKCFFKDGKKFNAVDNVSFFLDKNEFCSLVGESGSGKTTLVRIISGLISPDSGTVVCDGESLTPRLRRKNKVICAKLQLVLQNSRAALDPRFSVYESIAEPIKNLKKCSRDEERKTVEKFIEQMELPKSILSQRSGELSGGQQKRVCIARALAADPDYIIFDEAVSGLDAVVRKNVLDLLIKIQKNSGKGCLLITHDIDAALYISQRIAVMKSGRILESVNYSGNIQVFKSEYAKTLISSSSSGIKKYDISVKNG